MRDIERVGIALNADDEQYKALVLQTLKGSAADFVARLIQNNDRISWQAIRAQLFSQYSDINDSQLALQKL